LRALIRFYYRSAFSAREFWRELFSTVTIKHFKERKAHRSRAEARAVRVAEAVRRAAAVVRRATAAEARAAAVAAVAAAAAIDEFLNTRQKVKR